MSPRKRHVTSLTSQPLTPNQPEPSHPDQPELPDLHHQHVEPAPEDPEDREALVWPTIGRDDQVLVARWLAEMERSRSADPIGQHFWQVVNTPTFAELWYEARNAGERVRASAVASLYARHAHPGGRHPDPRQPATYSERAIVAEAYRQLPLAIWQRPPCAQHEPSEPLVMLMTYTSEEQLPPKLVIHADEPEVPQGLLLFHMACMLGYLTRERKRMLDPDAPHGGTFLPMSPEARAILHQFAFAFLCLEPDCPPEWNCQCNAIRRRFNAPPDEHDQPTDTLTLADLRATYPPRREQP